MKFQLVVILILSVLIISGCTSPDSKYENPEGGFRDSDRMPPMEINESMLNEVSGEFERNNNSTDLVENYCKYHMLECMHYCRIVNPNHDACTVLQENFEKPREERGDWKPPENRTMHDVIK